MTFPVELHLLGWNISAHQVLEYLAYAAGFQLYLLLRRRWPHGPAITPEQTAWIMVGALFGALFGAKLLAWAESFPLYWPHRHEWRILIGGKTIVGAILGGWVGVQFAKRRLGLSHPSGDIYVFPVILGMCIGRVGCFSAGLTDMTYGIATALPWGVDFGDGLRRHPTQIYELLFLVALGAFFAVRMRSGRQRGCMFSQFVFAYLCWRFAVEFLKPRYTVPLLHLSAIQIVSLAGVLYAFTRRNADCCARARARALPAPGDCGCADGACGSRSTPSHPLTLEITSSVCTECLQKIEAKLVLDAGRIYLQKFCPDHGPQRMLVADDADYWRSARRLFDSPPTAPLRPATPMQRGCPWDCGLCPDHEQHTCLAILEITDQCDLGCPICYAGSSTGSAHRPLEEILFMMDAAVAAEGRLGVLQVSGGEPTLHPNLFAILDAARARPIQHLMLNTNGRTLAEDPQLARRLADYRPGFEVYLQFDSLDPHTLRQIRGQDLSDIRRRALAALNAHGISTTLVVTLVKGINDRQIGEVLDFALSQPCVRGVAFQPIQAAGRLGGIDPANHRLTLTEVRRQILRQHTLFTEADLVPIPCHPDALAMGYAIRRGGKVVPLSRFIDPMQLVSLGGNTICYEQDPNLRTHVQHLLAQGSAAKRLKLQCCLPLLPASGSPIRYEDIFRVIIMQFMDAWSMDLRSLRRSCVHIVQPDGRLIPFETCNVLHRNRSKDDRLATTPG